LPGAIAGRTKAQPQWMKLNISDAERLDELFDHMGTEWGMRVHFTVTFEISGHFLGSVASTG